VINEFMAKNPNIKNRRAVPGQLHRPLQEDDGGDQRRRAADLSVSYESFVSEYQAANVVLPLDDYINSSKYGLSAQDLQDFYPGLHRREPIQRVQQSDALVPVHEERPGDVLQRRQAEGSRLTPPKNWEEFVSSCKKFTGDVKGYAINIDASTFNGAVYANGGKLINDDQKSWAFNGPAGIKFMRDVADMVQSGCATRSPRRTTIRRRSARGRSSSPSARPPASRSTSVRSITARSSTGASG
jgi:hypothetical protein